eukprot:g18522.t1
MEEIGMWLLQRPQRRHLGSVMDSLAEEKVLCEIFRRHGEQQDDLLWARYAEVVARLSRSLQEKAEIPGLFRSATAVLDDPAGPAPDAAMSALRTHLREDPIALQRCLSKLFERLEVWVLKMTQSRGKLTSRWCEIGDPTRCLNFFPRMGSRGQCRGPSISKGKWRWGGSTESEAPLSPNSARSVQMKEKAAQIRKSFQRPKFWVLGFGWCLAGCAGAANAHKVLANMGNRLHAMEHSETSVAEMDAEMGHMIEALHEVEADFENLCRQHSQILDRTESGTSRFSSKV